MSKQTYVPTEADRLTGENVRQLRRLTGETLAEVIEGSGVGIGQSSLSRIELGQRALTMPEATKLAAYWNTTPAALYRTPKRPALEVNPNAFGTVSTEQEFLGNDKPGLFAVSPEAGLHLAARDFEQRFAAATDDIVAIRRSDPMTPEQYRAQVWIPYLENRYSTEQKAG